MKMLDRNKPFGEVVGMGAPLARVRFVQSGLYFNAAGEYISHEDGSVDATCIAPDAGDLTEADKERVAGLRDLTLPDLRDEIPDLPDNMLMAVLNAEVASGKARSGAVAAIRAELELRTDPDAEASIATGASDAEEPEDIRAPSPETADTSTPEENSELPNFLREE